MPTFYAETTRPDGQFVNGNNMLDVRLTDGALNTLTFPVTLPVGRYRLIASLVADLPGIIEAAMDAAGDATFNTGNNVAMAAALNTVATAASTATTRDFLFLTSDISGNVASVAMEFLFASGDNKDSSAWKVLGFEKGKDVGGTASGAATNDPFPTRAATLVPVRFVDVFVDEFPEFQPLQRISLVDNTTPYSFANSVAASLVPVADGAQTRQWIDNRTRVLSSFPVRKIRAITVRMEFEGGVLPLAEFDRDFDLTFDLIVLSPEQKVPVWVDQVLEA